MGLLAGDLARIGGLRAMAWRLFLGVGVLGGFTTFSAFSLDAVDADRARRTGGVALGYALVSVIGSVLALFGGLSLVRAVA